MMDETIVVGGRNINVSVLLEDLSDHSDGEETLEDAADTLRPAGDLDLGLDVDFVQVRGVDFVNHKPPNDVVSTADEGSGWVQNTPHIRQKAFSGQPQLNAPVNIELK